MTAPRGWSKASARRQGRSWRPGGEKQPCYYCGVRGCDDCGEPPALLQDSGIIPDPDDEPPADN